MSAIGRAAIRALTEEYDIRNLKDLDSRALFTTRILGAADKLATDRPFLWETSDKWDFVTVGEMPKAKVRIILCNDGLKIDGSLIRSMRDFLWAASS